MALEKIRLGTNDDGTPHYLYKGEHLVYTGPNISGPVALADGSTVDVTDLYVEADSPTHALAISDAIGQHFEKHGHPLHRTGEPFLHTPSKLTHGKDGKPLQAFTDAVHEHVPAGKDSSAAAILARLSKKG